MLEMLRARGVGDVSDVEVRVCQVHTIVPAALPKKETFVESLDKLQGRLVFFCVLIQDFAILAKSDQVPVCYILCTLSRSNL